MIEFRCTHQDTDIFGIPSYCNQLLAADPQHIGRTVRCPKCQQMNVIPKDSRTQSLAANAPPVKTTQAATPQFMFQEFDPFKRCPKCGAMLDDQKHCTKCRYTQRKTKSDDQTLNEMDVKLTGFLLFIRNRFAVQMSPFALTAIYFSLTALLCIVIVTIGYLVLGGYAILILPVPLAIAALSIVVYLKVREFCTVPGAELDSWQKPIWDFVLSSVRGSNWNTKFIKPDSKVIDGRADPPTDQELLMYPDLNIASVVDLEGAPVSDAGLVALRSLKDLRYIVLKNTQVTREGVFRLQQTVPQAWIWY